MVHFATPNILKRSTVDYSVYALSSKVANEYNEVFLSHSSKDQECLPGVIDILQGHGGNVYCDLNDKRMPKPPSKETAEIIKDQIKRSKKLVLCVSENSAQSKWVPWELGLGDMNLNKNNVALFPISSEETKQDWAKQEYLGLYRNIVYGRLQGYIGNVWMVYDEDNNTAEHLSNWLGS